MTNDITRQREQITGRACDHTRGTGRMRNTAITVCRNCRDYLCSICGLTIAWHAELYVTNPPVQWRYCEKPACVKVEAEYHGHPAAVMLQHRDTLRSKRMLEHLQDRGIEPRPPFIPLERTILAKGTERIKITLAPFKLDPGEACWCNRGKDCDGSHEIFIGEPVHVCGQCGQTFQITKDDPHWSTGRGPICPTERKP